MASPNPAYQAILNDLNRDVAQKQPDDVVQFCADWFQDKLRKEVSEIPIRTHISYLSSADTPCQRSASSRTASPSSRRNKGPGNPSSFDEDPASDTLSPFEKGPSDGPFSGGAAGARNAAAAAAAAGLGAGMFSSPFGGNGNATARATDDSSPFSEEAPGGPFGNASPFGASPFGAGAQTPSAPVGVPSNDLDDHAFDEPPIPSYALGRRTSVSAESLVPTASRTFDPTHAFIAEEDEDAPEAAPEMPVFPKSDEQLKRIREAIRPNFLFRNLDEEQEHDVLAAMKEIKVQPGETVIQQGDAGDYFYIVESGELDIFVKRDDQVLEPEKGDRPDLGKWVHTSKTGESFGELALMHKYVTNRRHNG